MRKRPVRGEHRSLRTGHGKESVADADGTYCTP